MALGSFIAGRYTSTLASAALGLTENGYEVTFNPHAEQINRSDGWGDTLIDLVYRGVDVGVILNGLEYSAAGMATAFWPWNATIGNLGVIARLGSAIAGSLVLTATANTPAASSPASSTFSRALLAPGAQVSLVYNSTLRKVPIRFVCLPNDSGIAITNA